MLIASPAHKIVSSIAMHIMQRSSLLKKWAIISCMMVLSACSEQNSTAPIDELAKASSYNPIVNSKYGRNAEFSYPAFSGSYHVGSKRFVFSDPYRLEPFTKDQVENRKLSVRFYYPTVDPIDFEKNYQKLPVISDTSWKYLVGHQQRNGKRLKYSNYRDAKWDIFLDSPLSHQQTEFPVLIFSHGYGYSAESYSALSAELASQGYIVVSINHTFGANPSDIGQQKHTWAAPLLKENIGAYLPIWSADQIFIIDTINQINNSPDNAFYQKLDLAHLGLLGHSYGGAASYYTASQDPRVKAIMNIDGTIFNAEDIYIEQPFAFILSKDHQPKFNFEQAGEQQFKIRLPAFKHVSFTDHILWWQWDHDEQELGLGEVDAYRAVELTSELVNAFFTETFYSTGNQWFNNTSNLDNEIIVEHTQTLVNL